MVALTPSLIWIPTQYPPGEIHGPSPWVSPPTESSGKAVKETPVAFRAPLIIKPWDWANFTTVPLSIVNVAPLTTVTLPSTQ